MGNIETVKNIIATNIEVDWINDVTGGSDTEMIKIIASSNYSVVIMHNLGVPANPAITVPDNENVTQIVMSWLKEKIKLCECYGVEKSKIIIDPGIGFGKTAHQSLQIIKNIENFKELGCQILVGHSRKSFFNLFTDKPYSERDIETYVTSVFLASKNVDYLRVHDVEGNIRALEVAKGVF